MYCEFSLRPPRRWHETHRHVNIRAVEVLRQTFECRWRVWRVRCPWAQFKHCDAALTGIFAFRICVDTGRGCSLLLTSPLAASQNFEVRSSVFLLPLPLSDTLPSTKCPTSSTNRLRWVLKAPPASASASSHLMLFLSLCAERVRIHLRPPWRVLCIPLQSAA